MGGMQTVLALLAVVLFSSMTLNSYNNLLHQSDVMEASFLNLQAQEIVDKYFQKIECNMAAGNYSADSLARNNNINTIIPQQETIGTTTFTFKKRIAKLCNKDGSLLTSTSQGMVLVQVVLEATYGDRQVTMGTSTKIKSAVFSEAIK